MLVPQRCEPRRGQILVIMALLMVALLSMVAIAVDLGFGYAHRREVQNAADSAAMAGALALGRYYQYNTLSATERINLGLTTNNWDSQTTINQEITNAASMSVPPFPTPSASTGRFSTNLTWPPSGTTGTLTGYFYDTNGNTTAIGTSSVSGMATQPVGIRVVATLGYPTFFARIFGQQEVAVQGTARAMLRPISNPGIAGNGPFIVCGGPSSGNVPPGNGAFEVPQQQAVNLFGTSGSTTIDYATYQNQNFMVHWSHMGQSDAPNTDCGGGSNMNGLSNMTQPCTPISSGSSLPCNQPYTGGTVAGTTTTLVAGLPGCSGTSWNNCVMILPVSNGCSSQPAPGCRIVTYAAFIIYDGTLPQNLYLTAGLGGCTGNCHVGQLLPAGMINGQTAGSGTINPASPGLFGLALSCDPVGTGCSL